MLKVVHNTYHFTWRSLLCGKIIRVNAGKVACRPQMKAPSMLVGQKLLLLFLGRGAELEEFYLRVCCKPLHRQHVEGQC
jgi:hypothetical protein